MVGAYVGVSLAPMAVIRANLTAHRFWRASTADALYNAAGRVERGPGAASSAGVGTEIDLTATYRLGNNVSGLLGYSRLWPGAFVRQTGPADTITFVHGSIQVAL